MIVVDEISILWLFHHRLSRGLLRANIQHRAPKYTKPKKFNNEINIGGKIAIVKQARTRCFLMLPCIMLVIGIFLDRKRNGS
jgi:hypothetical protein